MANRNHGTWKTSRLSSPLLCIWEFSGSNLGLGNGCPASDFSRFSSVLSGECQDSTLNNFQIASVSFLIYCSLNIILSFFLVDVGVIVASNYTHGHTHSLGRTPLGERSARRRDLYLTTHNTYKRHPCPRRDSNPQSQQASRRRPMPQTARPPRSANYNSTPCNPIY